MAQDLGNGVMKFTAETSAANKAVTDLKNNVNGLNSPSMQKATGGSWFKTLSTGILGIGAASTAGFGFVSYKVKGATDDLGKLSKKARDVGTDINSLRNITYVAKAFQADAGDMASALKNIKDTFPEQDSVQVFMMLREQVQGMADPVERTAFLHKQLGESAAALYPMLMANNKEFKHYADQAAAMNIGNSLQIEKVEEAKEATMRLSLAWDQASKSIWEALAVKAAPLVIWLAEHCEAFFADTEWGTKIITRAWDGFRTVLGWVVDGIQALGVVWYAVQAAMTTGIVFIIDGLMGLLQGLDWAVETITGDVSNMAGSLKDISDELHKLEKQQWKNVKDKAAAPWWSTQLNKELDDIEKRPLKKKWSFEADDIPESKKEELEAKAKGLEAKAPAAIMRQTAEQFTLVTKFRNGELLDKKDAEKAKAEAAQLDMQRQIRDKIAEQNKPAVANF